jgi:hypothetical protein
MSRLSSNRPSHSRLSRLEEQEDDDFFDAVGDQETLQNV